MISPFFLNDSPLHLSRYPENQVNRSLQAWDSADELIIDHLLEQNLLNDETSIAIFNDSFGALTTRLNGYALTVYSDSWVSQQGIQHNIALNNLSDDKVEFHNLVEDLNCEPDVVLIKIPKSLSLLELELRRLQPRLTENTVIIAGARVKDIQKSAFKLFEDIIGPVTTSLAVKKSRLLFCSPDKKKQSEKPIETVWNIDNPKLVISNHANVFSRESLDIGARFFMEHIPQLKDGQAVLDLGCGNGVLGLVSLHQNQKINCHFADESFLAVSSARKNVDINFGKTVAEQCQFHVSDCLSEVDKIRFDTILCNPPFHQQHAVTDHIAWQMFNDSFKALKQGGELRIVGNRQLGYHIKLKRIFGNCKTIASNKKFVILSATKR